MRSKNKPTPTAAERRHIERLAALPCVVCDEPGPSEEWRAVPGYEGFYEVSDQGRVRSLSRAWKSRYAVTMFPGRILAQAIKRNGYPVVSLSKNNSAKQFLVHRLVLIAFVGPQPTDMEACHENGIRTDARAANLRWDSRSANHQDKHRHGTAQIGEKANNVKLTDAIVLEIRRRNLSPSEAQREFLLSATNAKRIVSGKTWRHLNAE